MTAKEIIAALSDLFDDPALSQEETKKKLIEIRDEAQELYDILDSGCAEKKLEE